MPSSDPSIDFLWYTTSNGSVFIPSSTSHTATPSKTNSNAQSHTSSGSASSSSSFAVNPSSHITTFAPSVTSAFSSGAGTGSFSSNASLTSTGTTIPQSSESASIAANSNVVCAGRGIDDQAIGLIATLIISSVVGFLIWLLFAYLRPRLRQLYAVREWFVQPSMRPPRLSNRLWAFLFLSFPLVPSAKSAGNNPQDAEERDARTFPSDEELMQRGLWLCLVLSLGWTFLGLVVGLPLYIVSTPCLGTSVSPIASSGQLSTLQDLSLLRLLALLNSNNITIEGNVVRRETIDGHDFQPNVTTRLIVLTVLVLILGVIPAAWKIIHEFNKLVALRERWLLMKCGNMDLVWLSTANAPGFAGWGERRLKEFFVKCGLTPRGSDTSNPEDTGEDNGPQVEIRRVFTICDTTDIGLLLERRDATLNKLEEAESAYIAAFRATTPDVDENEPHSNINQASDKPQISRPKVFSGSMGHRRRQQTTATAAPSSYVAPSSFYRLRNVRGVDDRSATPQHADYAFSRDVQKGVVGTKFRELNRDSRNYDQLPLGSSVQLGESGDLEPATQDTSRLRESRQDAQTGALANRMTSSQDEFHPDSDGHPSYRDSSDRGTFAIRASTTEISGAKPPHLRIQPRQPYIRPFSGYDHTDLSSIYEKIKEYRSGLKVLNESFTGMQQDLFVDISEGKNVKGWLITGVGSRFLPGAEMIEGRSKSDVRWGQLQLDGSIYRRMMFWMTIGFIALLLGASLLAVVGLFLSNAPYVTSYLHFLKPLTAPGKLGPAVGTTFVPALAAILFTIFGFMALFVAARHNGSVSFTGLHLSTLKGAYVLLTVVCSLWLVAVGSTFFAIQSFDSGGPAARSTATGNGSLYMATLLMAIIINLSIVSPGLMLLQPVRLLKVLTKRRRAITPRATFRAMYPRTYDPTLVYACALIGLIYSAAFTVIVPLMGPVICLFLFLALIAHRYLIHYMYCRTGVGQTSGFFQIWLVRRFASLLALQPLLLGLILLSNQLWVIGGVLLGAAIIIIVCTECYCIWRLREKVTLTAETRESLVVFRKAALISKRSSKRELHHVESTEERSSLMMSSSERAVRPRGSMASVLEMMSVTLAMMPTNSRNRDPIPLPTDDLDDLTATERAARTHPDAPPRLPPLAFADHAEETAGILYAPELLEPPPVIWLPNDRHGIALAEAYDLQRYHDLPAVIDIRSQDDIISRTQTQSR